MISSLRFKSILVFTVLSNTLLHAMDVQHQVTIDVGIHSQQGTRRGKFINEDKYKYEHIPEQKESTGGFFGVYDGHGGYNVSLHLEFNLHKIIFNKINHAYSYTSITDHLTASFNEIDTQVSVEQFKNEGSTAVVGMIINNKLYVANTGDSQLVLFRKDNDHFSTKEHKPILDEVDRIEKAGGKVIVCPDEYQTARLYDNVAGPYLAVSRAIGDFPKPRGLICTPDVHEIDLTPSDEFIILASDGFWDFIDKYSPISTAYKFVKNAFVNPSVRMKDVAKGLCGRALVNGSEDDITVMIVKLKWD